MRRLMVGIAHLPAVLALMACLLIGSIGTFPQTLRQAEPTSRAVPVIPATRR